MKNPVALSEGRSYLSSHTGQPDTPGKPPPPPPKQGMKSVDLSILPPDHLELWGILLRYMGVPFLTIVTLLDWTRGHPCSPASCITPHSQPAAFGKPHEGHSLTPLLPPRKWQHSETQRDSMLWLFSYCISEGVQYSCRHLIWICAAKQSRAQPSWRQVFKSADTTHYERASYERWNIRHRIQAEVLHPTSILTANPFWTWGLSMSDISCFLCICVCTPEAVFQTLAKSVSYLPNSYCTCQRAGFHVKYLHLQFHKFTLPHSVPKVSLRDGNHRSFPLGPVFQCWARTVEV